MTNQLQRLSAGLAVAGLAGALWTSAAAAAWEPAQNVDNQSTDGKTVGDVGYYVGLADGGNGTSTAYFSQTVGSGGGFYAIRRAATPGAWGSPASASFPSSIVFINQPLAAAADANGDSIAAAQQNAGGVPGVYAGSWPSSVAGPGGLSLLMSTKTPAGGVTDPSVAFDSSGNGYAVAGERQGATTDEPILISTYSPSSGTWSTAAPIKVQVPGNSNCANGPGGTPKGEICGQQPRLAVSPDGTVTVAYLQSTAPTIPVTPATYKLYAVRAPAGGVAGSGGANSFVTEHLISANGIATTSAPGGDPNTTPPNFDVAIDGADVSTIVDAESTDGGLGSSIFATRWLPGLDPGSEVQISSTSQAAPPAAEPRVVATSGGDVTAAWTESGTDPRSGSLLSTELVAGAKNWTTPVTVSSSGGVDSPANPNGYAVNTPPFWLAEDQGGTAFAVWTSGGSLQDATRQAGKAWSVADTISGVSNAVAGTARVTTGQTGQADAVVVANNGSRNALYATRFNSPLPPPSTAPSSKPQTGPSATPSQQPPPEVPCNARPVLRIAVGRSHATRKSIVVAGSASEHVCLHASAAQQAHNHLVKVYLTIYRPAPLGNCRFLKRNGKLTATIPCSRAVTFVARGTKSWILRLNLKLPSVPGGFLVRAWAIDGFGRQSPRGPSSVTHLRPPKRPLRPPKRPFHHKR